jgi:hypothetical protein
MDDSPWVHDSLFSDTFAQDHIVFDLIRYKKPPKKRHAHAQKNDVSILWLAGLA